MKTHYTRLPTGPLQPPGLSRFLTRLLLWAGVLAWLTPWAGYAQTSPAVFNYTGGEQVFTVPTGITTLTVVANGAQGGNGSGGKSGGQGGRVTATLTVTPGQSLSLYVGGVPFNGGGGSGSASCRGGGATDIRVGSTSLSDRIIVAGGGGGAGLDADGGGGGGLNGNSGGGGSYNRQGGGGGQNSGGGGSGGSGQLGSGGAGTGSAGGGGGGYYGGGGANFGAGGGGGSSYPDPANLPLNGVTSVVHQQGVNEGNGSITLSWVKPCATSIAATPSLTIPIGGSVTLTASGATTYTWSNGSTQNPLVLTNVTSASTLSVTGVTGGCSDIATATIISTQPGAALNFNGSSDYISNTTIFPQAPAAYTIEFWIKPGAVGDYFPLFQSGNGWGGFTFHASANGGVYVGTNQSTRIDAAATGANTITAGSWQHFAFTYANGTGTLYKNGAVVATKTGMTAPVAWNGFRTGDSNGSNMVNGSLDEFRVWNVARTQAQIQANYQCELSGSTTTLTAAGLVAYYNFNQGNTNIANTSVNSLTDASGNNNTASLNNFALSGSTSNWVAPGGVTTGNSCASPCALISITAVPSQTITSGSSVTLTASGATTYTWSNGSTANPLVLTNVTSATTLSVTGVTGQCSGTASAAVSVTAGGPVLSITPPAPLTIGPGNCPATLTFIGSGKRFEVTGPGGYYFPVPYRSAVLNRSTLVSGIKATGTYTIRAFGDVGQTPMTQTIEVTGTGCQ